MSDKIKKLNSLLQKTISKIINQLIELPKDKLVTISRVGCTANLNSIKIFVSCFPIEKEKETIKILQNNHQLIIEELNKKLKLRKMPKLFFKIDNTEEYVSNIDKELNKIQDES